MADVPVYEPLGGLVQVPEEQLERALQLGYKRATPEDLRIEQARSEYGGIGGQAATALIKGLGGAFFGADKLVAKAIGEEETLRNLELANPQTAAAAPIAGMIGAALATGGTSAGARALAATPAGLAARAGNAAAARLGIGLGAAAETVGGTAARFAAGAATEAAIQGAGEEAVRLAVDNELSGEKLAQIAFKGLTSAGIGAVVGAGLGATGAVIRNAARKIPENLQGTELGREVQKLVLRTHAKRVGIDTPEDIAAAEQLALPEIRDKALRAQQKLEELAYGKGINPFGKKQSLPESLTDDLNQKYSLGEQAAELIRDIGLKRNLILEQVADDADAVINQRAFANAEIENARQAIAQMRSAGRDQFAQAGLNILETDIEKASKEVADAIAVGGKDGAADLFIAIDKLKRGVGRATAKYERLRAPNSVERETQAVLKDIYGRLQKGLENQRSFGGLGGFQAEMNGFLHNMIGQGKAVDSNWYAGYRVGPHPVDPWSQGKVSSPEKVMQHMEASARKGTNNAFEALREHATQENGFLESALRLGDWTNLREIEQVANKLKSVNDRIFKTLDEAEKVATAGALLKKLGGESDSVPALVAGAAIGTGNPALAIIAPLASPRLFLRSAELVENIANGQAGRIGNAVSRAAKSISAGATASAGRLPVTGAAYARYQERSKLVKELQEQAPIVQAELEKQTSWLADRVPNARQQAVATALRNLEYLSSNLPKGLAAPTPFSPPLPPSRSQVQEWLNRLRAVENPISILEDLEKGRLTPEAVDAVRTVYPATFADIQAQVMDKMTSLEAKGKKPAYAKRVELGLLLGIPTDPTMTPEAIASLQSQYQAQPAQAREGEAMPLGQAKGRKAPDFAAAFRSGSAETELTSEAK